MITIIMGLLGILVLLDVPYSDMSRPMSTTHPVIQDTRQTHQRDGTRIVREHAFEVGVISQA